MRRQSYDPSENVSPGFADVLMFGLIWAALLAVGIAAHQGWIR